MEQVPYEFKRDGSLFSLLKRCGRVVMHRCVHPETGRALGYEVSIVGRSCRWAFTGKQEAEADRKFASSCIRHNPKPTIRLAR